MSPTFPPDRFDDVPVEMQRRGAHRGPRGGVRGWVVVGWAALATFVIVAGGSAYILGSSGKLQSLLSPTSTPTPSEVATAAPTVAPAMAVRVLNGTPISGLATTVADQLAVAGIKIASKAEASQTDVAKTMVFYAQRGDEGAARGVCEALANECEVKFSSAYDNDITAPLTLVIGADFKVAEPTQ